MHHKFVLTIKTITYGGILVRYLTTLVCCFSVTDDDMEHSGNVIIGNDLLLLPPEMHIKV